MNHSPSTQRLDAEWKALLISQGLAQPAQAYVVPPAPDLPRRTRIKHKLALWREYFAEKWRCFKHRNDYK